MADLRKKLLWLSIFRMVATSLMLAALAVRLLSAPPALLSAEDSLSFTLIAAVYLLSLIYAVWLRRGRAREVAGWVQVLGDVVLATSLVYLTGGPESPFTFAYLVAIVAGSILLFQRGAVITAMASSAAFALLTLVLQWGLLRLPQDAAVLSGDRLAFLLVSNVLAQFLIAVLAGYLSRQLAATGGRLSARESDLAALAELHRQILASMPSGLLTCGADGRVTFANRAAEQILGRDAGALNGRPAEEILPGVDALGGSTRRGMLEVPTPQGQRALGLTTSTLASDPSQRLVVFTDLTELRRMEEELKRVDRLAALGKLSAQLAHEIRNPLAAMRGSAQMLTEAPEQKNAPRLAQILVRESDRLTQLVEDFLRFARPPPPMLRRCSLREVVTETLEMLSGDPAVSAAVVQTELGPEDVLAQADPDQVRQVLINMLRNAVAAVGPGGRVKVSLGSAPGGGSAELRVWDSAGSIPPEDLTRVFEPFFTTRQGMGGTGLGLSTAHSIVRAHGGTVRVTSSRESGTEFVVSLPAAGEVNKVADTRR